MVGCTTATVRACNKTLSGYGYCHTCESGIYDGCINIILPEYRDYHKTAAEGGRGYITMSSGMMHKILGLQGVNTLRLNLKGITEIDSSSASSTEKTLSLRPPRPPTKTARLSSELLQAQRDCPGTAAGQLHFQV